MTRQRKLRVVLFGPALNAVSGVSTHVNMLLGSTLALDFDLLHFQVGSEGRKEGKAGKLWRMISSPFMLAAFLLHRRPDIVHLNTSLDQKAYWRDLVYLWVACLMGRKVVNQIHGGALPQNFFPRSGFLTWILRRALLASHAVTVLSSEELKAYRAFDPRINVHLVPNAIEVDELIDAPRAANRDAPLRLVYVGRLVATKGLFEVVEALKLLKSRGVHFSMQIAGGGPDDAALREAVLSAGLERETIFLGPVFGDAKHRLWLESDLFVFPTWHKEGLPYSILEAMAAGCVSVTCPVAAIPDVMQDGVHGVFVPPKRPSVLADALARLDEDRDAITRMAQAGRDRIKVHYTTARLADDFRRLYLEL
jgi:glycosyltransferase involved in cell wall biosynthesis